jgi:hypothetical protein
MRWISFEFCVVQGHGGAEESQMKVFTACSSIGSSAWKSMARLSSPIC